MKPTLVQQSLSGDIEVLTPLSAKEFLIFELLLTNYPEAVPFEYVLSAVSGKSVGECKHTYQWALNNKRLDEVMRNTRDFLSSIRVNRLPGFELDICAHQGFGYALVPRANRRAHVA